ncbi:MAG TPA: SMP-30/gluconolactonase/LRE family protein [Kiloniellales bacterium]|nr:SMP-30/gluconolactonase/LRE family protein [Kiloniellales bacterium]
MTVEVRDPRMRTIVAPDAELEVKGSGFLFTEGPLWHPVEHFLLFSDMPGNVIRRWDAAQGVQVFRQPSAMANGLAYDREGRLLACQHATSSVTRTELDGSIVTLATHYDGKELNSPNDIVVKSDGSIYFTDPTYGRQEFFGVAREPELQHRGVYRLSPEGDLTLLVDDFAQPNGLCFSADEKLLFVNDTERGHVRVFDVLDNGLLGEGRLFAEPEGPGEGAPDGMKLDSDGNLYTCGPGGVHVFDPAGTSLGVIRVPEVCANFTWGGPDLDILFLTASTSLYALKVKVPGKPAF